MYYFKKIRFLGEKCHTTKYGCCPDRKTPALGRGHFGCKGILLRILNIPKLV